MLYSPRVMDTPVDTWLGTPRSLTCRQFVRAQQTVALENSQHLDGLRSALLRILGQRIASIDQLVDKASSSSRWRSLATSRSSAYEYSDP